MSELKKKKCPCSVENEMHCKDTRKEKTTKIVADINYIITD